jgi:gliding motility-associated-like protein
LVNDYHNCPDSIFAQVDEPEEIIPSINSSPLSILGLPYKFNTIVTPNVKYKYYWNPKQTFGDQDTLKHPTIILAETTLVQLKVTNYKGCSGIDTITINGVIPIKDILPNAYTPNSDNLNETFGLPEIFETQQFQIRNPWGIIVFENSGVVTRWDGKFQNEYVPTGTYTYLIQAKLKGTDQVLSHQGTITIIK